MMNSFKPYFYPELVSVSGGQWWGLPDHRGPGSVQLGPPGLHLHVPLQGSWHPWCDQNRVGVNQLTQNCEWILMDCLLWKRTLAVLTWKESVDSFEFWFGALCIRSEWVRTRWNWLGTCRKSDMNSEKNQSFHNKTTSLLSRTFLKENDSVGPNGSERVLKYC